MQGYEDSLEKHLQIATTPEAKAQILSISERLAFYASFTVEQRQAARIARFETLMREIGSISDVRIGEDAGMMSVRLARIWSLADGVPDIDLEEDIAFMTALGRSDAA